MTYCTTTMDPSSEDIDQLMTAITESFDSGPVPCVDDFTLDPSLLHIPCYDLLELDGNQDDLQNMLDTMSSVTDSLCTSLDFLGTPVEKDQNLVSFHTSPRTVQCITAVCDSVCSTPSSSSDLSLNSSWHHGYDQHQPTNTSFGSEVEIEDARFEVAPSNFCHICCRKSAEYKVLVCGNIKFGSCRKVVCIKCHEKNGWNFEEGQAMGSAWLCTHCTRSCPSGSQCSNYKKTNDRIKKVRAIAKKERMEMKSLKKIKVEKALAPC